MSLSKDLIAGRTEAGGASEPSRPSRLYDYLWWIKFKYKQEIEIKSVGILCRQIIESLYVEYYVPR